MIKGMMVPFHSEFISFKSHFNKPNMTFRQYGKDRDNFLFKPEPVKKS